MTREINVITEMVQETKDKASQKVTIELPEGLPSNQLRSAMAALDTVGDFPQYGPLGKVSSTEIKGDLTLEAAIRDGADPKEDTLVTMRHYQFPKHGVGGVIEVRQQEGGSIPPQRLPKLTLQMNRMGLDALDYGTGVSISKQLERTATSDKAVLPEPGVRKLEESRPISERAAGRQ